MNKLASLLSISLVAALAACGGDDDNGGSFEIENTPLTGLVAGESWSFVAGHTDAFLSEGEDTYFSKLHSSAFTACGSDPSGNELIILIPKVVGEYPLGLAHNVTFSVGAGDNLIATRGKLVVDEVTATTLKGGLATSFDGDNDVNGKFEITICAG